MQCGYCKKIIKEELSFKNFFKKEKNYFCESCSLFLKINKNIVNNSYAHYYFASYDCIKDDIYKIKYFGDVAVSLKYKQLLNKFFKEHNFDLISVVPTNKTREAIRGFNQVELICNICEVNYIDIFYSQYRKKQAKLHEERTPHRYFIKESEIVKIKKATNILIIDDIFTSGNTLLSVADAILSVNNKAVIAFLTLAKTNEKQY